MYTKPDGTRVTSFAPGLKAFAGGAEFGTAAHEAGLEAALRRAQAAAGSRNVTLYTHHSVHSSRGYT